MRIAVIIKVSILLWLTMSSSIWAVPRRIIILRHGEKKNDYQLSKVGRQRSLALQANYLGKNSINSLFPDGIGPDGIFTITLHTLELASPTAQSWGLPLEMYSVVPLPKLSKKEVTLQLNQRTQEAAKALLTEPRWKGKTVVMIWEHDHIAKSSLEKEFPNEEVTLRQLLHLDKLPNVPKDWSGDNYDYFWIIDYDNTGSSIPIRFTVQKQIFAAPYQSLPDNDWGKPES